MVTHKTLNEEQEALWYLGSLRIIQAIGEQAGHTRSSHRVCTSRRDAHLCASTPGRR